MRKQKELCGLCGHRIPEFAIADNPQFAGFVASFDHIVPRAHGGEDSLHKPAPRSPLLQSHPRRR